MYLGRSPVAKVLRQRIIVIAKTMVSKLLGPGTTIHEILKISLFFSEENLRNPAMY